MRFGKRIHHCIHYPILNIVNYSAIANFLIFFKRFVVKEDVDLTAQLLYDQYVVLKLSLIFDFFANKPKIYFSDFIPLAFCAKKDYGCTFEITFNKYCLNPIFSIRLIEQSVKYMLLTYA